MDDWYTPLNDFSVAQHSAESVAIWPAVDEDPVALGMNLLPSECMSLRCLLFNIMDESQWGVVDDSSVIEDTEAHDGACVGEQSSSASPGESCNDDEGVAGIEEGCNCETCRRVSGAQPTGYALQFHFDSDGDDDVNDETTGRDETDAENSSPSDDSSFRPAPRQRLKQRVCRSPLTGVAAKPTSRNHSAGSGSMLPRKARRSRSRRFKRRR